MLYKLKCVLLNTQKKLQTSYIVTFFIFFLKDEEFVSKTIMTGSIDLDRYTASKVRQLAKKMEASKATVCHIKQIASDPQVAQISLMRHQWTDLRPSKHKRKVFRSRPTSHKHHTSDQQVLPYKRMFDPKQAHTSKERCLKCGDSRHVEGFKCPVKKYQCKSCHNMDILPACVSRKKYLSSPEDQKHTFTS